MSFSREIRYRVAEKILKENGDSFPGMPDRDLRFVHFGFSQLLIHRPMNRFGRVVGLKPGTRSAPSKDLLYAVIGHHRSEEAVLRDALGESDFKNLTHLRRGTHELSATTRRGLATALGVSESELAKLEGRHDKPVLAISALIAFQLEFVPSLFRLLSQKPESLLRLRENTDQDAHQWWSGRCPGLEAPESVFIDRLITMAIGIPMTEMFDRNELPYFWFVRCSVARMAKPARDPIGNWLVEARELDGCHTLKSWYQKRTADVEIEPGRLKKWSAGKQTMPIEQGHLLIGAMRLKDESAERALLNMLLSARLIAVVRAFVAAASPVKLSVLEASQLVFERTDELELSLFRASRKVTTAGAHKFLQHVRLEQSQGKPEPGE